MLNCHLLVFGMFTFIAAYASAAHASLGQQGMDSSALGNLHVHVFNPSDNAAGLHLWVRLMSGSSSTPVSENFTNDQGRTDFTRFWSRQNSAMVRENY